VLRHVALACFLGPIVPAFPLRLGSSEEFGANKQHPCLRRDPSGTANMHVMNRYEPGYVEKEFVRIMKHTKHSYVRSTKVLTSAWIRKNLFAFVLVWFAVCLPLTMAAQTPQKNDIVLAYSTKLFIDVDPKDAQAAFTSYSNELARELGLTVSSIQYEDTRSAIELIRNGKADMASLGVIDYLHYKNSSPIELGLGSSRGEKKTTKYLLLTHAKRGYEKIGDLKGKKLLVLKGDDIGPMYLTTVLLRQRFGETKDFFSQVEERSKASQVALPVFFGQADACIINDVSYKIMVEMNPQLGRDLKTLLISPEYLNGVGVFRKGLPGTFKERIINAAKNLKNYARGKQVLLLFKLDDLEPLVESDLTSVKSLLAEYEQLKQRR
jgi:ABC-type phosphate/phosphonate transport system substrate-binding protein